MEGGSGVFTSPLIGPLRYNKRYQSSEEGQFFLVRSMLLQVTHWLLYLLFIRFASSLASFEVPPICRPQLQTANCWYYRPNYVYNHLLDQCIWSGWSSCNSKMNSFRTRRECETICLGSRRRSGSRRREHNEYHSPGFYEEVVPRKRYWPYEEHSID
ncbi:unnamed protein product [Hydatigera taeniaeformis]|uniref:BPTI/Kunitz inhibitor domain-containing protein n=1 Tax=Hydatigena taeniaeformis TaxID=6205 RepID=A0A158RDE2_HYDTA|nr:unnamed protein product [Hydatigera taeniaeformis]